MEIKTGKTELNSLASEESLSENELNLPLVTQPLVASSASGSGKHSHNTLGFPHLRSRLSRALHSLECLPTYINQEQFDREVRNFKKLSADAEQESNLRKTSNCNLIFAFNFTQLNGRSSSSFLVSSSPTRPSAKP